MAAAKDDGGSGEMAAGNGRRLHLGIPEAVFVEDVDSFMKQPGNETADIVLKKLDEQYQKYKFMELNLAQKKRRLKGQIPEIKQTLEILKYMQKKKVSVFLFVNMSEPGYFRRGASSLTVCHWCQPSRAHVLTFRDKRGFVVPPTPANQV